MMMGKVFKEKIALHNSPRSLEVYKFFDVVRKFKSILKFALHLGAIENEASVV